MSPAENLSCSRTNRFRFKRGLEWRWSSVHVKCKKRMFQFNCQLLSRFLLNSSSVCSHCLGSKVPGIKPLDAYSKFSALEAVAKNATSIPVFKLFLGPTVIPKGFLGKQWNISLILAYIKCFSLVQTANSRAIRYTQVGCIFFHCELLHCKSYVTKISS